MPSDWLKLNSSPGMQLTRARSRYIREANPSEAELLKKREKSKLTDLKANQKKAVLDKYGGAEYLDGSDGLATENQ
jgi:hypothetical protein